MNDERRDKLKELKDRKGSKEILAADGKPFIDALEAKLKQLAATVDGGIDVNGIDSLLHDLAEIGSLKEDVNGLKDAIQALKIPTMPDHVELKGVADLVKALKNRKDPEVKIDMTPVNNITDQVGNLIDAIESIKVPKQGQKPEDYVPMRRVMLMGKTLVYDDSFYTGGGGGSSSGGSSTAGLTDVELRAAPVPTADPVYTTRIDAASATVTYIGNADPGSATTAALWQIKKIDSTNPTSIIYAGGTDAYTNIWDDRAGLAYS